MPKILLISFLIPFCLFSQTLQTNDGSFYSTDSSYIEKIDEASKKIFASTKLDKISFDFEYLENNINDKFENLIITNYWTNSEVNFTFQNDNLSYVTPDRFDSFRRGFYQKKDLNILVYLNEKNKLIHNLKTIHFKDFVIGSLKIDNFISATYFDKNKDRFIQLFYYLENGNLVKTEIKELNAQFSWDIINYYDYYFNNGSTIFETFHQSLMDGRFSLEPKYEQSYLLNLSNEILKEILSSFD